MTLRPRWSRLPATLCLLLLAACGNPINVRSDFDRSADYGSYRSYAFYSPLATDKAGYASLTTEYFTRAPHRAMAPRRARAFAGLAREPAGRCQPTARRGARSGR